jgi:hypothetical protein
MARIIYHVAPMRGGGWTVKRRGAKRASGTHVSKGAAIRAASRLAARAAPAQVVIHSATGTIVSDRLFEAARKRKVLRNRRRAARARATRARTARRAQRRSARARQAALRALRARRRRQLAASHRARRAANRRRR